MVHATTLFTNALIERKGAPTGLLVTDGFRDMLEIADATLIKLLRTNVRTPDQTLGDIWALVGAARIDPAFREDGTNARDDTLLRVGMRRQDLTSPAAAAIVIVDHEIGKRAADIDAKRIFVHLPI